MSTAAVKAREQVDVIVDGDLVPQPIRAGTLYYTAAHGHATFSFAYAPDWLAAPEAFEIDPQLQLHTSEAYPAHGNFGIFLDSAPDRWGRMLLDRRELVRAKEEGRRARQLNDWDYLLGVHDDARIGALRFRRGDGMPFLDCDGRLGIPPQTSLRELQSAAAVVEQDEEVSDPEYQRWLALLLAPGSSLGGARPKASFREADGSVWLAKFPSRQDRYDVAAWEMLLHGLAHEAGIAVPPARLVKLGKGHRTFAAQRFDRIGHRRRFFVSSMSLLGAKDGEGGSYLDLAQLIQDRAGSKSELEQLWTRVVFNILVSNRDDHLRNHGFILTRDGWRLSPAFDMNPNIDKPGHALAIDERDASPDVDLALQTAPYYGLTRRTAESRIAKIRGVVAGWQARARALQIPRREIELMASAFNPTAG